MNPFDILIIVILGFALIRGFFRGLVREVASIAGVVAGFYAANAYHPVMGAHLSSWISDPAYVDIISFTIIFVLVFILTGFLGVIITYILKLDFLGWADRLFGTLFGLGKGFLIVAVMVMMLTAFLPKNAPIIQDSLLAPRISFLSEKLAGLADDEMKQNFTSKLKELKKEWLHPE